MPDDIFRDALIAYLIQYLGLGSVFFFGLWVAFRQGDVGLKNPRQRRWLAMLVGGFLLCRWFDYNMGCTWETCDGLP